MTLEPELCIKVNDLVKYLEDRIELLKQQHQNVTTPEAKRYIEGSMIEAEILLTMFDQT